VSGSEFGCRAISFVKKEGPTKNVIVSFQKYHSHIGGNEIEDSVMTIFFLAWNRKESIVRRLVGHSQHQTQHIAKREPGNVKM